MHHSFIGTNCLDARIADLAIVAAVKQIVVEWPPEWIGAAASVGFDSLRSDASVGVVKVLLTVSSISPDGVVVGVVVPDGAQTDCVLSVTVAQVLHGLAVSVVGADDFVVDVVPSVVVPEAEA